MACKARVEVIILVINGSFKQTWSALYNCVCLELFLLE